MGISRAAVWKGILRLREDGWQIDAAPRVGYKLISPEDGLMPMDIYDGLESKAYGRNVEYHREINSTNILARANWLGEKARPTARWSLARRRPRGRGKIEPLLGIARGHGHIYVAENAPRTAAAAAGAGYARGGAGRVQGSARRVRH